MKMFRNIENILIKLEVLFNYPVVTKFSKKTFITNWVDNNNIIHADLKYFKKRFCNTRLLIVLTTFSRPDSCLRVITSVNNSIAYKNMNLEEVVFLVLNDKSQADYQAVKIQCRKIFGEQLIWLDSRQHHGKKYFWCVHQMAFLMAKAINPEMYLYLQDDIDFSEDLLVKLDQLWMLTEQDKKRRVIYLFSENNDDYDINGRWINFRREIHPSGLLRKTQWLDLQAFYCDLKYLIFLRFWVMPVPEKRWKFDSTLSSGVGMQITRRSFGKVNIYQSSPSLIMHGYEQSVMNIATRALRPFDNR